MSFIRKKHGPWRPGHSCLECGNLFEPNVVCPNCGNRSTTTETRKGHKQVSVRNTWTQVPELLNLCFLSMLFWDMKLEKKPEMT
jgi:DNA-directed RNA polymerase subunit RPC12/RpoP